MSFWISTDLDGTLLDHDSYSYAPALAALELCEKQNVPIVLNTSKTQAETAALHRELNLATPIVVENGSALIFTGSNDCTRVFGEPRSLILDFIESARISHNAKLTGFNDLGVSGIVEHTGLSLEAAELAADKRYSEPFIWQGSDDGLVEFKALAAQQGLSVLKGGRFHHVQGQTDKGKPLEWLKKNLEHLFLSSGGQAGETKLICLGDNQNDLAMLGVADYPVWVRSSKEPPKLKGDKDAIYTKGLGPEGWNEAVQSVLKTHY